MELHIKTLKEENKSLKFKKNSGSLSLSPKKFPLERIVDVKLCDLLNVNDSLHE